MTETLRQEPPPHIVKFAVKASQRSPCRSKRGVVLFVGDHVVTHGYNYKPRGFDCDGSELCKATCRAEAIHAEQQALLSAGPRAKWADLVHVKTVDGELVPSGGPSCVACSKLILVAGVVDVWLYQSDGWHCYTAQEFHRASLESALAGIVRPSLEITGDTSDGYHTFNELYEYRKAYNALAFNEWARQGCYDVHKSRQHSDGEACFGGGWFIVVAETPAGQISNHYKDADWNLFHLPERERGNEWDGHTPQVALSRLLKLADAGIVRASSSSEKAIPDHNFEPHIEAALQQAQEMQREKDAQLVETFSRYKGNKQCCVCKHHTAHHVYCFVPELLAALRSPEIPT